MIDVNIQGEIMGKKILMISTYGDFFWSFERDNISILKSMGYEICLAANFQETQYNARTKEVKEMASEIIHIPFQRKPFKKGTIFCLILTRKLIRELKPVAVDCHLAVVGTISRLACWNSKQIKVIYSPHGFFFYKGCPLLNMLLFKPTEFLMAHKTDALITINSEDYDNAKRMKIRGNVYYVPGVGVDVNKISHVESPVYALRDEINADKDSLIFFSVGELSFNKNHVLVIEAMHNLQKKGIDAFHYVICGREDKARVKIFNLVQQYGLEDRVHYLGFRNDVIELDKQSNVFVLPSFKEGLSVSIMEAMVCRLPILASDIRGNKDLIKTGKGGFLFNPNDAEDLSGKMEIMLKSNQLRREMGEFNAEYCKKYSIQNVSTEMRQIYQEVLGDVQ